MDSPSSMSSTIPKPPNPKDEFNQHDPQHPLEEDEEEEEELELGLTLGAKATTPANRSRSGARTSCRILTAKDFPSSPSTRPNAATAAGTKRTAADSASPDGRPPNSSSQMVVGWPPVRSFRINNLFNISKDNTTNSTASNTADAEISAQKTNNHVKDETKASGNHDQEQKGKHPAAKRSSCFVKVKMDGDPIGRKVDLSAHHSYESLAITLELMFQKPGCDVLKASKLLDGSSEFSLTYEDKDGDWMLVGDVPWRMFFNTVKRLRIMRTSDGKGAALE